MKINKTMSLLLLTGLISTQASAVLAEPSATFPAVFNGWNVTNGEINYMAGPESVCNSMEYDCFTRVQANGFKQIEVSPSVTSTRHGGSRYLVTFITDEFATGDSAQGDLDYYQVNISKLPEPIPQQPPFSMQTHSERHGVPSSFPIAQSLDQAQLYQGEIKGVLEFQLTPDAQDVTILQEKPNFIIKFLYNPAIAARFGRSATGDWSEYRDIFTPAISSFEITVGDKTWTTNFGYLFGQEQLFSDFTKTDHTLIDQLFLTAYAENAIVGENEFFGLDFYAIGEKIGSGAPFPVQNTLTTPPASWEEFDHMGITLSFDHGAKTMSGLPTSFTLKPVASNNIDSEIKIIDIVTPVRMQDSKNLHDGDLTTYWKNEGSKDAAWFEVVFDKPHDIVELRLAPRTNRAYRFNVSVDGVFVGQYTTTKSSSVELQSFSLPEGTTGSLVRVESVSHKWFKVHEVELESSTLTEDVCGADMAIKNMTVPAKGFRKNQVIDYDASPSSLKSKQKEPWFLLSLWHEQPIKCIQLAPRKKIAFDFNVYVDGRFVKTYTTLDNGTNELQSFILPAGTKGTNVRVHAKKDGWFKVHEAKLQTE